ncbi:hypothetical protein OUZ56_032621 [Daphnia magna]|uniref:Uncharacterized protein n=1 Tax=Daphnia magna TaxID=35525 RepID=A0ABR0B9F6_9CRUS|nr:hypothetical protein OUZ56_032621 [Daphnia magna]
MRPDASLEMKGQKSRCSRQCRRRLERCPPHPGNSECTGHFAGTSPAPCWSGHRWSPSRRPRNRSTQTSRRHRGASTRGGRGKRGPRVRRNAVFVKSYRAAAHEVERVAVALNRVGGRRIGRHRPRGTDGKRRRGIRRDDARLALAGAARDSELVVLPNVDRPRGARDERRRRPTRGGPREKRAVGRGSLDEAATRRERGDAGDALRRPYVRRYVVDRQADRRSPVKIPEGSAEDLKDAGRIEGRGRGIGEDQNGVGASRVAKDRALKSDVGAADAANLAACNRPRDRARRCRRGGCPPMRAT